MEENSSHVCFLLQIMCHVMYVDMKHVSWNQGGGEMRNPDVVKRSTVKIKTDAGASL